MIAWVIYYGSKGSNPQECLRGACRYLNHIGWTDDWTKATHFSSPDAAEKHWKTISFAPKLNGDFFHTMSVDLTPDLAHRMKLGDNAMR